MSQELPEIQAVFRKGRGTRDQIVNIHCIIEKARKSQKSIYFCFIDYAKAFDSVDHNKLLNILKEMGMPDHITCLLRNLYAGQVVWYSHLSQNFPQFFVIHTVKGFSIVTEAEVDVSLESLEFSWFLYDPVGNLISGSSAFSKTSMNI